MLRIGTRLERLGADVADLTDLEAHVRRHPLAAVALAAGGGAIAGSLLVKYLMGETALPRPEISGQVSRLVRKAVLGNLVARVID